MAEEQAKLLEQWKPEQSGTPQEQRGPEALAQQKKSKVLTERGDVLNKEIAELEEIVKSGIKVEPGGRVRQCERRVRQCDGGSI